VYSKLRPIFPSAFLLALGLAVVLTGQAQAPAPVLAPVPAAVSAQASSTGSLRGHIADPTGALIPGAKVSIITAAGKTVATTTADSAGYYSVTGLPPGSYVIQATFDGFAPFQSAPIPLAAAQSKRVEVAMAIEVAQQSVTVSEDDSNTVNVEAGGNISAVILKGKDLEALSDDPDELSNELSALAGPSAGPNGGQIYIDGFSGGQLPPKSAIREIRINQNPFSAEFDRLGYGRIEILTKPGTDKLHGQFFLMGNDKNFNTGNPFTSDIPSYYSYQFNGTLNGALSKTASFFLSAEQRNTQSVNTWSIPDAVLPDGSGVYQDNFDYGVNLLGRRIRDNVSARIDWQLGAKNTLTARYGFWSESEHGDLNSGSLASASTHESNTDHTVQLSDAIAINDHLVNESRFQYERQNENHYPDSTARSLSVAGDFQGGGYSGQELQDHTTRLEFQNLTTMSHGAHAIKFGTRMRDTRDANLTNAGFNGNFSFSSASAYKNFVNGLQAGKAFKDLVKLGYGPSTVSYTTGGESALANVFDLAFFAQDDWKVSNFLTLSGGMRWEAQNHIADHDDWAPRVSLAYALDGHGKGQKTKTVLRAGYGIFYDRFTSSNLLTINRSDRQSQIVLVDPGCSTTATSLGAIDLTVCTSAVNAKVPVKDEVASGYHSPYTQQAGASIERQLRPGISATVTYLHSFGVHQQVTRNANQAIGGTPQTSTGGYLYQYFSEGVFKENQMILSTNAKITRNLSVMGSYTFSSANSTNSASDAYDLSRDYGRASFVARNQLFLVGSYTAPWGIRFNPFLIAQSGRPYNITLPTDSLNELGNQRPSEATSADCATDTPQFVATSFGCLNTEPGENDARIAADIGNGPAAFALNLRISRGFGIGPKLASATPGGDMGPGGGGPPPGGGRGGGPGGGGPGGGGPGGGLGPGGLGGGGGGGRGMFGGAASGRKYTLNFSVQALNLFNDVSYGLPSGVITPTPLANGEYGPGSQFGHSTSLAGQIFSQGSAVRRIFGQVVLSF